MIKLIFVWSLFFLVFFSFLLFILHVICPSLDDEEEHPVRYIQLTPQYRMAIRAIRKVSEERVPTVQFAFCMAHRYYRDLCVYTYYRAILYWLRISGPILLFFFCFLSSLSFLTWKRPYNLLNDWKLDEVPCGATQVQGGSQALRRQRRHWAVLSWSRRSLGASESITSQVRI